MLEFDGKWSDQTVTGLTFFDCQNTPAQRREMILDNTPLIGSRVTIKITAPANLWWMIRGGIMGFPLADATLEITPATAKPPFSP